jgi:hypothetical protein
VPPRVCRRRRRRIKPRHSRPPASSEFGGQLGARALGLLRLPPQVLLVPSVVLGHLGGVRSLAVRQAANV